MTIMPRILITTYHSAFLVRGGGEFEIISLADSLKKLGYIVDIYGPFSRSLENYDVILHFSVHGGGLDLLREVKAAGKPIILWPNLWVHPNISSPAAMIADHVSLSDFVVFKSIAERENFTSLCPIPTQKIKIIPAGVESIFTRPAPPKLFQTLYGVSNYAIWFGVIEPNKNQLSAIRALRGCGINLVFVGKYRDRIYYETCRREAPDNCLFIDGLPYRSEIMRAALQEATFYLEVSKEPPGLSAIAAGLAGCKLVLSDSVWSREHFSGFAEFVDPGSLESIRNGVHRVMASESDSDCQKIFLQRHLLPEAITPFKSILSEAVARS